MAKMSYLVQQGINNTLDLIKTSKAEKRSLPNDLALSHELDVSRTTVRTVVEYLCNEEILKREGTEKVILRRPKKDDYFDISNEPSSKEEQFEKFFHSLINTGQLQPGDRFSELDLAKKSNCITITVRESLIKFSRTGLIKKKPRAQWQMVEFNEEFANELIEFRKILEQSSIRALLERPDNDPVWGELETILEDHKHLQKDIENRYNDFPSLDSRLHKIIQSCTGNRFVSQFFDIVTFVCHYHYQWDRSDERDRNAAAVNEHIDLITKMLSRDFHGAVMSLDAHLDTAHRTLMRSAHGLHH